MKIICTVRELFDADVWVEYCRMSKSNVYAVADGMPDTEEVELTKEQAQEIGLI